MRPPPINPDVDDLAPSDAVLTVYDEEHMVTYLRIIDAHSECADWREVTRIVLHIDPERDGARRTYESHLKRAVWMAEGGWRLLLRG
ncbi:MAG: DNA -binding domain-containing protein, partial [Xanthobacteraceae bacterium]